MPFSTFKRGAHSREGQTQFHEGDGHGRPHPHYHRLGVEDAGHGRDAPEHPADEGVDDLEGGNIDEDGAGARLDDAVGEIFLECGGEPVVHVHLDGDEEIVTHLEDGDAFHG